ncbi:branched-chain amino acid ABC transporter permease [Salipiger thiooxidans]|uniref:branched-chain amino acid ABC transporter permease n=1 Tax=Salipiger thiooxidans TaxID=282683 RepID=UPI001CD72DA9|nr:branched-chain amino acid ABC transporter permease [Salipiger thiooxidans]MCA0851322.1 branched-chain amino acid ABC transporter permease [Salipiger thiooxidans]
MSSSVSQPSRAGAALGYLWPLVVWGVVIVALSLALASISPAMARIVTDTLIKLIIVTGLYIFVGNSGILSFGHGAFLIVSAYASAWLTIPKLMKGVILPGLPETLRMIELNPIAGLFAGVLLGALLALLVGIPLMRLSGIAASIATFAFFSVISVIYNNWTGWTKGTASLVGLPLYVKPWMALVAALVCLAVAWVFQKSRYGLMLRATREDLVAARASGIRAERLRLIAFVLSAAVVSVGGVLWGHNNGALTTANNVYLNLQFIIIAMLVVGGVRSLSGVVVGTLTLSLVGELFRRLEIGADFGELHLALPGGSREVLLGLCMLLALVLRPAGLTMGRELPLPRVLRRDGPPARAD